MEGREYTNWLSLFDILCSNKTPRKLKIALIEYSPKNFILAIEEILINLRVSWKLIVYCLNN